jgi:hypothetical protein
MILDRADHGAVQVAWGAQVWQSREEDSLPVHVLLPLGRHVELNRPRMLSLGLDTEGFLGLFFDAPSDAWPSYARALSSGDFSGLKVRQRENRGGRWLDEATRAFEPHLQQVGALLFVRDELAGGLVVSHPDDYRALHPSILEDLYEEALWSFGSAPTPPVSYELETPGTTLRSVDDLRLAVKRVKQRWSTSLRELSGGLLSRGLSFQPSRAQGPFQVRRFATTFDPVQRSLFGEMIVRQSGRVEYLKLYTLSRNETRRAVLLERLAENRWNLGAAAKALGLSPWALEGNLRRAGFGYLLRESFLTEARRQAALSKKNQKGKKK